MVGADPGFEGCGRLAPADSQHLGHSALDQLVPPMPASSSSSSSSSDIDEDLLSLHQDSQTSSRTTLRSNSPPHHVPHQPTTGATVAPTMPCEHITELLANSVLSMRFLKHYRALVMWGAQPRLESEQAASERPTKRRKLQTPACGECGKALARPFVCLECSFSGCWSSGHISDHLERTGHDFALDVRSGSVFCAPCDDLIYNDDLECISKSIRLSALRKRARIAGPKGSASFNRPSLLAQPTSSNSSIIPCQGRKGFLNLGATCYLNVVLQSLLHNPLLKSWFMSDQHPNQLCSRAVCVCCEMDKLMGEIYSKDPAPLAPTSFLQTLWRISDDLAGQAQQDAHEVLITILNSIHSQHSLSSTSQQESPSGSTSKSQNCQCPVHTAFGASLQSEVTCGKCGTKRSTVDPMLDVSLEFELGGKETSLVESLRRYTRLETLGPKEQVVCHTCAAMTENATRQLSIKKLPPVLCFQFKRFKQSPSGVQKIDAPIRYPSSIDMTPFTTHSLANSTSTTSPSIPPHDLPDDLYQYDLFAVINHEGQMDTGHYTAYARSKDLWHKFDDEKVSYAPLADALSTRSKAYMCFYVRRELDYGPNNRARAVAPIPGPKTLTPSAAALKPPLSSSRPYSTAPSGFAPSAPLTTAAPVARFVPPPSAGLPPRPNF